MNGKAERMGEQGKVALMRAMVYTRYGPPEIMELRQVDKPEPQEGEVLVRNYASAVTTGDWRLVIGRPFFLRLMTGGLLRPRHRILGADIAGQVESVGEGVTQFAPGDEVYGDIGDFGFGGYAEFVAAPEKALAPKPKNVSFEEAAASAQAAVVALQGLREVGEIQAGHRVLVVGASGGIGSFAVQIAKALGAEVSGVCGTRNLALVRSLGADHVIDYTREDFAQSGQQYDLILATVGYRPIGDYERALSPQGTYVMSGGTMRQIFEAALRGSSNSKQSGKTLTNLEHKPRQADLLFMNELFESGRVKSVIDRTFPLEETSQALNYYGEGHATGVVAIKI
jgi:NADPH:quinone reductase-like Zn-dependent oxidoreductase